jgi:hypothetical protein
MARILLVHQSECRHILAYFGIDSFLEHYFGWILNDAHNLVVYFYLFLVTGGMATFFFTTALYIPHDPFVKSLFVQMTAVPLIGDWFKLRLEVPKFSQLLPEWHLNTLTYYENQYVSSFHWYIIPLLFVMPYISLRLTSKTNAGRVTRQNLDKLLLIYDYDYVLFDNKFCSTCLLQK